jgi:DNA-binding transcriptional MerR regulator
MDVIKGEELLNVLAGIRKTESPGRKGGEFPYARTVYACFEEIQKLRDEGFTMATIRSYLEGKGVLPAGTDPHSFCRAFRRETARRQRAAKQKAATAKNVAGHKGNAAESATAPRAKQAPGFSPSPTAPVKPEERLRINSDGTFNIRPTNLDDLPDLGKLR